MDPMTWALIFGAVITVLKLALIGHALNTHGPDGVDAVSGALHPNSIPLQRRLARGLRSGSPAKPAEPEPVEPKVIEPKVIEPKAAKPKKPVQPRKRRPRKIR